MELNVPAGAAPRVSIGMPVYNGVATLGRALDSLLAQTFRDFDVLVSDNASTDGTAALLEEYARRDPRIRLVRQSRNVGAHANFAFVLRNTSAEYFMWAAADDHWAPEFVARNFAFLESNSDYVASVARVALDPPLPVESGETPGTYALTGTVSENIRSYIQRPDANSRFYGLYRREVLLRSWIEDPFWAVDWAVVVGTLRHGKHHEVPETLLFRSGRGASADQYGTLRKQHLPLIHVLCPLLRFTMQMLGFAEVRRDPRIWVHLWRHNCKHFRHMVKCFAREALRRSWNTTTP